MSIIIRGDNEENFEPMPLGWNQAVCAFVEDIGTQEGTYNGKSTKTQQIIICWELNVKMTIGKYSGQPFLISKFYNASISKKSYLCKDLEAWRGEEFTKKEREGFDIEKLIGINCNLELIRDTKDPDSGFSKIKSIKGIPSSVPQIYKMRITPPLWIDKQRQKSIEAAEGSYSPELSNINLEPVEDDLLF